MRGARTVSLSACLPERREEGRERRMKSVREEVSITREEEEGGAWLGRIIQMAGCSDTQPGGLSADRTASKTRTNALINCE
jgi:hypothetical protein